MRPRAPVGHLSLRAHLGCRPQILFRGIGVSSALFPQPPRLHSNPKQPRFDRMLSAELALGLHVSDELLKRQQLLARGLTIARTADGEKQPILSVRGQRISWSLRDDFSICGSRLAPLLAMKQLGRGLMPRRELRRRVRSMDVRRKMQRTNGDDDEQSMESHCRLPIQFGSFFPSLLSQSSFLVFSNPHVSPIDEADAARPSMNSRLVFFASPRSS